MCAVYMHACMCGAQVQMCMSTWRLEVNVGCLYQYLSTSFIETGPLSGTQGSPIC